MGRTHQHKCPMYKVHPYCQKSKLPIKYIMRLEPQLLTLGKNQQIQSLHSLLALLLSKLAYFSQFLTAWIANHVVSSSKGDHCHVELLLLLTFSPNVHQALLLFFLVLFLEPSISCIIKLQLKSTIPLKRLLVFSNLH